MRGAKLFLHRLSLSAAAALLLVLLGPVGDALAWTPRRGSPVRAAIIETIRPLIEAELGAPVLLVVSALNIDGPFAFVSVTPIRPGGTPIDWSRTRHARDKAADMISDVSQALLAGGDQSWSVLEFAFGPTDVPWETWVDRHRAPRRLFEGAYDGSGAREPPPAAPAGEPPSFAAAPSPPPAPLPPAPQTRPKAQTRAQPWAPGPDWRSWPLGDLTLQTPPDWRSVDPQPRPLVIGGRPWSATFSDAEWESGRGATLVFSWADDEFIFTNGLDDAQILGRGRQVFAMDFEGERRFFRLRDRSNDAQGFDLIAREGVGGRTFHMGCRAPTQRWPQVQDICEQILASLRLKIAPAAGAAGPPTGAKAQPQAVAPTAKAPAPDVKDGAFRAFTEALTKLEAFETSKDEADWRAGFEAARKAVDLQPDTADYWRLYGYAASLGADRSALAQQTAEDAFERAVALDPANTGARLLYAAVLIKRESWARALDQMEAALTTKPGLATSPIVADMARMYLVDSSAERGLAFFAKLSAKRPRAQSVRLGQATLAMELGRKAEALALAEKVAADPQSAQTDAEHANALLKTLKE